MIKPVPFGKYYLLERIGRGSAAEIFKARTFGVDGFERLVAVKRILPELSEDEEYVAMFIDEAKIAVQLQHANIAQVFDLGKVDDTFFIALEYVDGHDLRSIFERMRDKGEIVPIPLALYVVMQVCEGLDYAHNKRDAQGRALDLIHRDVAPENVVIGYGGEVKLIDFGIAKAAGRASKTQPGVLKGKLGYMSPEQARGLSVDKRRDLFAAGVVLHELLTGERLFVGETDYETAERVRNAEIVAPSAYNKRIPWELDRIVLKALARDPEDRFQNAIELHDDLMAFLYSVGEFFSRKDLSAWMKKEFRSETDRAKAKPLPAAVAGPHGAPVTLTQKPPVAASQRPPAAVTQRPPVAAPQTPPVMVPPRRVPSPSPPPPGKAPVPIPLQAPFPKPTSPAQIVAPYDGNEPYVFVSYARNDLRQIGPFLAELTRDGHRLWYDAGIQGSAEWSEVIEDKLKHCRLLLVFVTKASMESTWVKREIKLADKHGKPLLPVRLEPVELARGLEIILQSIQFVEAKGDFIVRVRRVLHGYGVKG